MDIHVFVSAVKEFVAANGRVPLRAEFEGSIPGLSRWLRQGGGSWTTLLHAAGLSSYKERRLRGDGTARLTNEIFSRPVADVIQEHVPEPQRKIEPLSPTVVIPDTHFPWVNPRVMEAIYKFIQKEKPSRVVQIGDLMDAYCHSRFPKSLNVYKPQEEEELARKGAEEMWATVRKLVPNAELVQLKGNHDIRALKNTLAMQPQIEHVVAKHYDQLMTFEGVTLIKDPRQEYIVGDVEFIHGYRSAIGEHRDYALMNAVAGHIHVGGTSFRKIRGQVLWELNVGLAGDPESKALGYTPQRITKWTPGFGFVCEYGPRFISA